MKSTPRLARLPSISRIRRGFDPPKGESRPRKREESEGGSGVYRAPWRSSKGIRTPCGVILGVRGGLLISSAFNLEENVMTLHPN